MCKNVTNLTPKRTRNNEMTIAVTESRNHRFVFLYTSKLTRFIAARIKPHPVLTPIWIKQDFVCK